MSGDTESVLLFLDVVQGPWIDSPAHGKDAEAIRAGLDCEHLGPGLGVLASVLGTHVARHEDPVLQLLQVGGCVASVPSDPSHVSHQSLLAPCHQHAHGVDQSHDALDVYAPARRKNPLWSEHLR